MLGQVRKKVERAALLIGVAFSSVGSVRRSNTFTDHADQMRCSRIGKVKRAMRLRDSRTSSRNNACGTTRELSDRVEKFGEGSFGGRKMRDPPLCTKSDKTLPIAIIMLQSGRCETFFKKVLTF